MTVYMAEISALEVVCSLLPVFWAAMWRKKESYIFHLQKGIGFDRKGY